LDENDLRGPALRALAGYTNSETAERILAAIEADMRVSAAHVGDVERAWSQLREAVAYAETQAGRAATWVGESHSDIWNELARHYRWAIDRYLAPFATELFNAIAVVVDRPGGPVEVGFAFPDHAPGKVYGLNRFLFMLLAEFAEYMRNSAHGFLGQSPAKPWGLSFPAVYVVPRHRTDLASTIYDSATRLYEVAVTPLDPPGSPAITIRADALLIRHGTRKPPSLAVRVGRLPLRLELGRIQLPFAAVF